MKKNKRKSKGKIQDSYIKRKKRGMFLTVLTLLVFLISISALGENYKKAYRRTILKFEKAHGRDDDYRKKNLKYSLVYVDRNKIPELVCEDTNWGYTWAELYTFYKGKVKKVTGWPVQREGTTGALYKRKKNSIIILSFSE